MQFRTPGFLFQGLKFAYKALSKKALKERSDSRFFGDIDLLFGYSSISNEKLLSNYGSNVSEY